MLTLPVVFRVGEHSLTITFVAEGRWTVSVDGGPQSRTYRTQVEAWEEGVRAADEQDRRPSA
ncbi:MAG: hypothetical protein IPO09_10500 [Anaeromyxobacter sp.]|nr:hypothetical protein [Anaeromyxobacter sp.]MBL0276684.1 hypothetical protein [Anaeromyxobacter sp.]